MVFALAGALALLRSGSAASVLAVAPSLPRSGAAEGASGAAEGASGAAERASGASWLGSSLFGCSAVGLRHVAFPALSSGRSAWVFTGEGGADGRIFGASGASGAAAVVSAKEVGFPSWRITLASPSPGVVVHFSGDISTEQVAAGYGAYLAIIYAGSSGRRVGLDESVPVVGSVTGALGAAEVWSTVPSGAVTMSLDLVLNGTGTARFDHLALSALASPARSWRSKARLSPTTAVVDRISVGLGVETNPFLFSSPGAMTSEMDSTVMARLRALRPAWARIFVATDWWVTPVGDNFSSPMTKALLEDARLYASLGARLDLVLWQTPSWAPPYKGVAAQLVALLRWLEQNGVRNVGLLTLGNEPDTTYIPGTGTYGHGFPSVGAYVDALKAMRRALDQAGFEAVGLVGGDVAVAGDGFVRAVASQAAQQIGQLSFHLYPRYSSSLCVPVLQASEMAKLGARHWLPAVMWESNLEGGAGADPTFSPGEVGGELLSATYPDALKLAAFYLQTLAAGIGGVSYWEAMDMTYPEQGVMQYGLWSGAGPPRPVYYAFGLLAHFVVPGATLRAVSGGAGSLIAYEAVDPSGARALYVVNPWGAAVRVQLALPARTTVAERLLDRETVQQAEDSGALQVPASAAGVAAAAVLPPESMGVFSFVAASH